MCDRKVYLILLRLKPQFDITCHYQSSSDEDGESGDGDGGGARGLDTSAGIPDGMTKAE